MQRFNVLDRRQNIRRNYIIEASAGTGKTYSIENIVVRLLIDDLHPYTLEEILVVTFTRAAADDLKMRIHSNIVKSVKYCLQYIKDESTILQGLPDYLLEVFEGGLTKVRKVKKSWRQLSAIFSKPRFLQFIAFAIAC